MMQRIIQSSRAFAYVPNFTNYHASQGDIALVAELKQTEFLAGTCPSPMTYCTLLAYNLDS
jgi:hypothetical protein